MTSKKELTTYISGLFADQVCHDDSNNGLQVEGKDNIETVAFAVDACQRTFDLAVEAKTDFLFVHHGLSWGGGLPMINGIHARRLGTLLKNDISLMAYHLPLDAHPHLGNNAVLAAMLNLNHRTPFFKYHDLAIGIAGDLGEKTPLREIANVLDNRLDTRCQILPAAGTHSVERIGIVAGGGAGAIEAAAELGLECLVTGEIHHQHVCLAAELGISLVLGGHYATETTGVKALMSLIAVKFPVACRFLDNPTGF